MYFSISNLKKVSMNYTYLTTTDLPSQLFTHNKTILELRTQELWWLDCASSIEWKMQEKPILLTHAQVLKMLGFSRPNISTQTSGETLGSARIKWDWITNRIIRLPGFTDQ